MFRLVAISAALTTLSNPAALNAQSPLTLRLGRGELGVQGQGSIREVGSQTGTDETFGQWLRLPLEGHLLHPRVIRYLVTLNPRFSQHRVSSFDGDSRTRDMGTDVTLQLFRGRRLSFNLQNVRSSGRSEGSFGSTGDFRSNSSTATATLRHRYFPVVVRYQRRSQRDAWSSAFTPGPVVRDQTERRVVAEIRNKKLLTSLSLHRKQDHLGADDFDARSLQLNHTLEWGDGSSLRSSFTDFDREGARAIQQRTWSEQLRIQHTRKVASDLFWSRRRWSRTEGTSSGSRNLGARVTVRPSPEVQISVAGTSQRIRGDRDDELTRNSITPTLAFTAHLPAAIRLNARLSVGLERLDASDGGTREVEVVDEVHSVDDGLRIRLDPLRIDPLSVDVWSEDRSLLFERGIDYRVVELGDLVEIQILPGGRVSPGSTVLVSYRYTLLQARRSQHLFQNVEGALIRGGLSFRAGHRERREEVFESRGLDPADGSRDTWAGIGYAGDTPLGAIRTDIFRRTRVTSGLRFDSRGAEVQLDLPLRGRLQAGLRGIVEEIEAAEGRSLARTVAATWAWTVSRSIRIRSDIRAYGWNRPRAHEEEFLSSGTVLTWTWGSIDTVLSYDFSRRWNGDRRTNQYWSLRMVRRF